MRRCRHVADRQSHLGDRTQSKPAAHTERVGGRVRRIAISFGARVRRGDRPFRHAVCAKPPLDRGRTIAGVGPCTRHSRPCARRRNNGPRWRRPVSCPAHRCSRSVSPSGNPSAPRKASRDRPPFFSPSLPNDRSTPVTGPSLRRGPNSPPVGHERTHAAQQTAPWFDHQNSVAAVPTHPEPG